MSKPKLFLLDAFALIYRAHFAFSKNPRVTSTGLNTGAIFGFCNSLLDVLKKEKPSHIGVAFDMEGPTFRHETFTDYKAHREAQPEDITLAIPYIRRLLEAFRIPILEMPGFEADDLIGTIARRAEPAGFEVYMMTMDKDYMQLVTENVFLYRPPYMGNSAEVYTIAKVLERFGIERSDQVRDILGLMGDAADNIPGIPGIGEKTAQKLIAQYGTVENLIAHASELKGKMQENVIQFSEQGLLSKELATIHCDVPFPFEPDKLIIEEPDQALLDPLFEELEFRTLKKRIFGETGSAEAKPNAAPGTQASLFGQEEEQESVVNASPKETIHDRIVHYHTVQDLESIQELGRLLDTLSAYCFDTETDALDPVEAKLVGLSFSWVAGEAYYVPVPEDDSACRQILAAFKSSLESNVIQKIGQNLKYDILVLKKYGVEVAGPLFDTMIAHYLIDPEQRHNMDFMAETLLNYTPISIETLIGPKGVKQKSMRQAPIEAVAEYAAEDADVTWQLFQILKKETEEVHLKKLLYEVEQPLIYTLADMEQTGVRIDMDYLREYSGVLQQDMVEAERTIYQIAGVQFNVSSPKQLGEVLFDHLKLDPNAKKTKTGQYATNEEVLSKLAGEHPIIDSILSFRELQKLKSTYVDALPLMISPRDGRVHTSFNQTVAATGRLSSTNPNLQNIPIRTDRGKEIRKAFIARDENHRILSADYSQIELRIMAAFSKDESMLNAFKNGVDIHSNTAAKVFGVPLEEVTGEMRRKAKMVNFGIIYGISSFGLAQRLSIPKKEAAEIIDNYFLQFPSIKQYMDQCVNEAREHEFVSTILGRRRYLRDIQSRNQTMRGFAERNAINAPIQGSAADMIKIAMVRIHEWMQKEKLHSKMVLQVHDELVFDAHESEIDILKKGVSKLMIEAIDLGVPMEVGLGVGMNWLEAH